jgi:hypothetical protein
MVNGQWSMVLVDDGSGKEAKGEAHELSIHKSETSLFTVKQTTKPEISSREERKVNYGFGGIRVGCRKKPGALEDAPHQIVLEGPARANT